MKNLLIVAIITCSFFTYSPTVSAQNDGFIYGTVKAWDGKTYTGQIRWGKEEAFWTDMFNASKMENEYIDFLDRDDYEKFRSSRSGNSDDGWWDRVKRRYVVQYTSGDNTHQFNCQFGNLKSIKRHGGSKVIVELRDGTKRKLNGSGYNDIGTKVRVYVDDLGKVELDWDEIEEVSFASTPASLESKIGSPLYGKVEAWDGEFEGLIQWDKDERVSTDILDGEDDGREMEIEFGNIISIKKRGRGSEVTTKTGNTYWLDDSNDVDDGNRGIVVTNPEKGRVVIDWDDFEQLTLMDAPARLKSYGSFGAPDFISGTVTTIDGKQLNGRLVYDLDEAYTFEVLNGEKGDTEMEIPFHNIKQIRPRSSGKSIVVLKSGDELMLEDSQDVSYRHTGILVFVDGNDKDPAYVAWRDVEVVELN